MSIENTEQELQSFEEALAEVDRLRRIVKRQERDNRMLSVMNENAERLRHASEKEKKLQYLYNDLLLENCPNMIFLFNEELKLVICSSACAPLLCRTDHNELKNYPFVQIFSRQVDSLWVSKIHMQNREAISGKPAARYDDTLTFAGGSYMHVQVAIAPIIEPDGTCRGSIMTVNDVSELVETKRRAEQAAVSKSCFLENIGHEIRTPMSEIKGLSELVSLSELDEVQRNYLSVILSTANALLNIIDDVLDFSSVDEGKMEFSQDVYSVGEMLAEVSNAVALQAEEKGLVLLVEAALDIPKQLVGDDVRVKQVMVNLLSNAVKYTHEGYVRLRLHTEQRGQQLFLACSVEDSGIGIRQEDMPFLFDTFARVDLLANRNIAGTGMGLAICRQLVRAMGGEISVESFFGERSVFSFAVPQEVEDSDPLVQLDDANGKKVLLLGSGLRMQSVAGFLRLMGAQSHWERHPQPPAGEEFSGFTHCLCDDTISPGEVVKLRADLPDCRFATLRGRHSAAEGSLPFDNVLLSPLLPTDLAQFLNWRCTDEVRGQPANTGSMPDKVSVTDVTLLVVDDNEINLMVSGEMLSTYGAHVVYASGGKQALEMCAAQRFDIIFIDHVMPEMDGLEVAAQLRALPGPNQKTPLVALAASNVTDRQSYYTRCGMDDYVCKPVEFAELGRVMQRWLPSEKVRSTQKQ